MTATVVAATAAAATASASASPSATSTAIPALEISPENPEQYVDLGAIASYPLTITNGSSQTGTINVDFASSQGWAISVLEEDGDPLDDTNDDDLVDIGALKQSESVDIVVRVVAPVAALAFVDDETTITVTSDSSSSIAIATLTTIINPTLVLTIDATSLADGDVVASSASADATGDGQVGSGSIAYVAPGGVDVTVTTNGAWTGTCFGQSRVDAEETEASLSWRLAGSGSEWVALSPAPSTRCFPNTAPGVGSYSFDLELEVAVGQVEDAEASVTFNATGARNED